MDKHTMKKMANNEAKIYSYSYRSNLIDTACDLAKVIKTKYPDTKYVKDITVEQINFYLKSKSNTCSCETLKQLKSRIKKLECICNKKFKNCKLDWSDIKIEKSNTGKLRDVAFSKEQVEKIKSALESKRESASKSALKVFMPYALRASEYTNIRVKDIDLNKMKLHIYKSKGGRSRTLDLRPESVAPIKTLIQEKQPYEKLFSIQGKSISTYLSRLCKELGFKEIISAKTSLHALRKYMAREYYKEQRKNHNKKEALGNTMAFLGHGRNRTDLIKTYLGDIPKEY